MSSAGQPFLSSLYRVQVLHHRLEPKRHRFTYRFFMFSLDLDEIDLLSQKLLFFARNRIGVFEFRDRDHLHFGGTSLREGIGIYLKAQGLAQIPSRIRLVTNLRVLGYVFNPVSFYFCYDSDEKPFAVIAEVGNTFGEMKAYLLGPETFRNGFFELLTPKLFYVSPFTPLDAGFHFKLGVPEESLEISIDDYALEDGKSNTFFVSRLWGVKKRLTNTRLFWYTFRFPFVTLQIIATIHFQAFLLWIKKMVFIRKAEHPELQRDVRKPGVPL
ncbi:MAG: DUF1365 domain-containing protein [Spirochaetia bacterium]|nr:DUF1365 domain-containing protein [Spirochaetia bacterium]